ncbi:helix-turn-helix domain-containing protein [uncultured Flavonifractor sp.]|uniref:helix-turn-helix domain-containing protein n=1 Tax=uncultured Flavonifractor sp. TaxID=1193534 RepID=UPI002619E78B|nr:helix-turn-helix transcriptional regulator [uncultured Flavonifractor sp.]
MITRFGKELRKIRIEHGEILKDMAEKLCVTPSFLSSVEVGKKNVPGTWVEQISCMYDLGAAEKQHLKKLAEEAVTGIKMDLRNSTQPQRDAALVFARDFGSLTDEDASRIIEFLNNKKIKEASDDQ